MNQYRKINCICPDTMHGFTGLTSLTISVSVDEIAHRTPRKPQHMLVSLTRSHIQGSSLWRIITSWPHQTTQALFDYL